jgi:Poly(3-hydroxybutyrate) depolymerase
MGSGGEVAEMEREKLLGHPRLRPIMMIALCMIGAAALSAYDRISIDTSMGLREALISLPKDAGDEKVLRPVIIAFHGHGGSMEGAAREFACESYWPEAIVVYPQGEKTPGGLIDPRGKLSGWQSRLGDEGDRDLAFFDSILDYLRGRYPVDERRIYALGHSNGGLFVYELWAARGDELAAIAAISAIIPPSVDRAKLKPMPVFHAAGRKDPLVKIEWQMATMDFIKTLDRCAAPVAIEGAPAESFSSPIGCELVEYIGDGGHQAPPDAMPLIVDFFKRNARESR